MNKSRGLITPWRELADGFKVYNSTGYVGTLEGFDPEDRKLIVRAVNSHEALLEVKQRAQDLADVVKNGGNYRKAVEWLDEAIALAEGKGE